MVWQNADSVVEKVIGICGINGFPIRIIYFTRALLKPGWARVTFNQTKTDFSAAFREMPSADGCVEKCVHNALRKEKEFVYNQYKQMAAMRRSLRLRTMLNVAIAEDNPKTMEVLNEMLEKESGVQIVGRAQTGEDALEMIKTTKPDVVLMDVIMPGMDGISVMEQVKNTEDLEKKPSFIVVSAAGSENVTEDAFRMGASYFIMKPFKPEVIMDKLHRIAGFGFKTRQLPYGIQGRSSLTRISLEYMAQNLENDITQMLHEIGVPAHIKGLSVSEGRDRGIGQ